MNNLTDENLAKYTSFGVGGGTDVLCIAESSADVIEFLAQHPNGPDWILGYGANTLISDKGLPGATLMIKGGEIKFDRNDVVVDAGVWWDDLVKQSIDKNLFGLELMSAIPGSVGAAVFININAYGQAVADSIKWVEIWQPGKGLQRIEAKDLNWSYKFSTFQEPAYKGCLIIRACFSLFDTGKELAYGSALAVANELQLDIASLKDRRAIIVEARKRAGSLWEPGKGYEKTVGSFFRNPEVSEEQAEQIITFDERTKDKQEIKKMNIVHGGSSSRVSAAHVLLAAGFSRGQDWFDGRVKLNEHNLLKIENAHDASATEIYTVAALVQKTVLDKLGIFLRPEASILGEFDGSLKLHKEQG